MSFRDLHVFQLAVDLAIFVYEETSRFPHLELYGLTSQMRKAAVSVVSNLAEGQGRITEGELRQFLSQARGSLFEVEAQCLIASRLAYLEPEPLNKLQLQIKRTNSALRGLIEYVRGKRPRERRTSNPRNLESP